MVGFSQFLDAQMVDGLREGFSPLRKLQALRNLAFEPWNS